MNEEEDPGVRIGPPETWEGFVQRFQRSVGNGARVFIAKQVGDDGRMAEPCVIAFVPGPFRKDLLDQVFVNDGPKKVETLQGPAYCETKDALDTLRELAMEDREDVDERDDNTNAVIAVLYARVLSYISGPRI